MSIFTMLLLTGCARRITDFTVISTKNVNLNDKFTKGRRVVGENKIPIIFGIPIGTPNMKEAIDDAIEKDIEASALADGVIYSKAWSFFIYGEASYVVEGTTLQQ